MTDTERTTPAPESATPTLNQLLGIRPTEFSQDHETQHIDDRPCPPWCYSTVHPDYPHEVLADHPGFALHFLEPAPRVLATCYRGWSYKGYREVSAAAVELKLEQMGQGAPRIELWLRRQDPNNPYSSTLEKRLALSIEDTWDLITALQYVVEVANGDREPVVEHDE